MKNNSKNIEKEKILKEIRMLCYEVGMDASKVQEFPKQILGTFRLCYLAADEATLKNEEGVMKKLLAILDHMGKIVNEANAIAKDNEEVFDQIIKNTPDK